VGWQGRHLGRVHAHPQSWLVFVAVLGSYGRRACDERIVRRRGLATGVVHACAAVWRGEVGGGVGGAAFGACAGDVHLG
jgi:hypothetical protein